MIRKLLSSMMVWLLAGCASNGGGVMSDGTTDEARTAAWFEANRHRPVQLRSFLQRMPKGGDVHSHLGGAVYAESYLAWAAADDFCLEEDIGQLRLVQCSQSQVGSPRVADAIQDPRIYNRLIDQMSVRDLEHAGRSGHDDFFATFREFGPVARFRYSEMLAEVASRAASEHVSYLELMITLRGGAAMALGRDANPELGSGLAAARSRLSDNDVEQLVDQARRDLDAAETQARSLLECDTREPDPGCSVEVRYLQQVIRTRPPAEVFAQLVVAFELVRADPRVVGLNMVGPEDDRVARNDYTLHMEMLDFLKTRVPDVAITLHAGELILGMVPPEDLRFHIRQAIELGHARRIGHGTSLAYESDPRALLEEMRERRVAVEICLTSSEVILGLAGEEHPFRTYLEAGIPLILATDDAGVSRIDLSHEFMRAARTYDLSYLQLKAFARNSLGHSFLPGSSLWQGSGQPVAACIGQALGSAAPTSDCDEFLGSSERARAQWRLEAELAIFEALDWRS